MFGERHDLPHEFPNHAELNAEMRQINPKFAAMVKVRPAGDALTENGIERLLPLEPPKSVKASRPPLGRINSRRGTCQIMLLNPVVDLGSHSARMSGC